MQVNTLTQAYEGSKLFKKMVRAAPPAHIIYLDLTYIYQQVYELDW